MVHLVHQREQTTELAPRKPFAGQPVEVIPGQAGDESALVFAEGHGDGDKAFKVLGLHVRVMQGQALTGAVS